MENSPDSIKINKQKNCKGLKIFLFSSVLLLILIIFFFIWWFLIEEKSDSKGILPPEKGEVINEPAAYIHSKIAYFSCLAWKDSDESFCLEIPKLSEEFYSIDLENMSLEVYSASCINNLYSNLAVIKGDLSYCEKTFYPEKCVLKYNFFQEMEGKTKEEIIIRLNEQFPGASVFDALSYIYRDSDYCKDSSFCNGKEDSYGCYQAKESCIIFSSKQEEIDCDSYLS
jgi:hypothetical protein